MEIIREVGKLREYRGNFPFSESLGLVPTMGALHEGHISLVRQSIAENIHTVVSIFVNPTQFGPGEDFEQYPRTWEQDIEVLESLGVTAVFAPPVQDIYPVHNHIQFRIDQLNDRLEGVSRPGHMEGVLQVVSILFHLVQPSAAYFGMKDYQQMLLIRQMVTELHFPIHIVPCPIVREPDGLALSSRNIYLSPEERKQALALHRTLTEVKDLIRTESSLNKVQQHAQHILNEYPLVRLDYFQILHADSLKEIPQAEPIFKPHAFIAAYLGNTRLIDNMALYE